MREKFETSCKIWPSKKERRKCLAQEFCRYSGLGCVVVPETKVQDAEEEHLNKAILGHVIDKAEQPRRRVTNSLATDMFDDADAYMAAGLLRRSRGTSDTTSKEDVGDYRRRMETETSDAVRKHMRDVDTAIDNARSRRDKEKQEKPNVWGPGTGHHSGGTRTVRRGRDA